MEDEIIDPVDPVEPTEPTEPTDPAEPTDPVDPAEPTDPADPVDPDNPTDPVDPEPYVPNHKYSFMDQEFEMDDKTKSFIKTKEDEDLFRNFLTAQKAQEKYKEFGGVREVEEKLGGYEDLVSTSEKYQNLNTEVEQLGTMLQQGTPGFEQFRNHLGIDKQTVLNWAIEEAKAMEDPSLRQGLDQQYQQYTQNFNLQSQNDMMQNRLEQQMVQQRHAELDTELGNSTELTQAYDNLVGTPGSFRQAVIDYGQTQHAQTGRDVSVSEAVKAVSERYQGLIANAPVGTQPDPESQTTQTPSNPEKTVVIKQSGKESLPNVGSGGGSTPARKRIGNLEQMRAHEKTL